MVNWSFLDYFVAAAKEQNFSKAANSLFYSQSYLSKKIAVLEEELGVALFERNGKKVTLTPAGEHLYEKAQKINREINGLKKEMKQFHQKEDPKEHPIIVYADAYADVLTTEIIQQCRVFHPEYTYQSVSESIGCVDDKASIHCYFTQTGMPCTSETLFLDQEKIYINKNSTVANKKRLELSDLYGCTCIVIQTVKRQLEWEQQIAPIHPQIHFRHVDNVFEAMEILCSQENTFEIWSTFSHEFMPLFNTVGIPLADLPALEFHVDLKYPDQDACQIFRQIAKSFCKSISS